MARPKKVKAEQEAQEAPASPAQAEVVQEAQEAPKPKAAKVTLNPMQARALELQAKRASEAEARKKEVYSKAKALSESFLKETPVIFLPYKDRDGKIVPALVLGGENDKKRDSSGGVFIDPKTKEEVPEYVLNVFVFSNCDQPGVTRYKFNE